jgi:hypothetical protein
MGDRLDEGRGGIVNKSQYHMDQGSIPLVSRHIRR